MRVGRRQALRCLSQAAGRALPMRRARRYGILIGADRDPRCVLWSIEEVFEDGHPPDLPTVADPRAGQALLVQPESNTMYRFSQIIPGVKPIRDAFIDTMRRNGFRWRAGDPISVELERIFINPEPWHSAGAYGCTGGTIHEREADGTVIRALALPKTKTPPVEGTKRWPWLVLASDCCEPVIWVAILATLLHRNIVSTLEPPKEARGFWEVCKLPIFTRAATLTEVFEKKREWGWDTAMDAESWDQARRWAITPTKQAISLWQLLLWNARENAVETAIHHGLPDSEIVCRPHVRIPDGPM